MTGLRDTGKSALPTPNVRERELELALARIERMSRPIPAVRDGKVLSFGRVEVGSLAEASRIAREVLNG